MKVSIELIDVNTFYTYLYVTCVLKLNASLKMFRKNVMYNNLFETHGFEIQLIKLL